MPAAISVRHNFETGHRLPILEGKCQSLHGHSWWTTVTVEAPEVAAGIVVEYGVFKGALRGWIDTYLDHGLMLGHDDPLLTLLTPHGKVFTFEPEHGSWPTVENVAALIARVAATILDDTPRAPNAKVVRVAVTETHVNTAFWTPS